MINQNKLRFILPQELLDKIANYFPPASRLKHIEEAKKRERASPLGNWI